MGAEPCSEAADSSIFGIPMDRVADIAPELQDPFVELRPWFCQQFPEPGTGMMSCSPSTSQEGPKGARLWPWCTACNCWSEYGHVNDQRHKDALKLMKNDATSEEVGGTELEQPPKDVQKTVECNPWECMVEEKESMSP